MPFQQALMQQADCSNDLQIKQKKCLPGLSELLLPLQMIARHGRKGSATLKWSIPPAHSSLAPARNRSNTNTTFFCLRLTLHSHKRKRQLFYLEKNPGSLYNTCSGSFPETRCKQENFHRNIYLYFICFLVEIVVPLCWEQHNKKFL